MLLSALLIAAGPTSRPAPTSHPVPTSRPHNPTASQPASQPASHKLPKDVFVPPARVGAQTASVLLYTGGLRSHVEPCGCQADQLGGLGRLTSLIKGYKRLGFSPFFVDAGNLFFEKLEISEAKRSQDEIKAELVTDLYRRLGLRAMGIGPHDLVLGLDWAKRLAARSGALVISSNLLLAGTKISPFPTRGILQWKGRKVGLLSLTATPPKPLQVPGHGDSTEVPFPKDFWKTQGLQVTSPEAAARREVAALRKAGAQMIILLSTMGINQTAALIGKIPGIDLAIDGHDEEELHPPRTEGAGLLVSTPKEGQKLGVMAIYAATDRQGWAPLETPAMLQVKLKAAHKQIEALGVQAREMAAQGAAFQPIADVYRKQAETLRKQDIPALQKRLLLPMQLPKQGRAYAHALVPLAKALGEFPAVVKRMEQYQREAKAANVAALKKIKPILTTKGGNAYVGVATCKTCHQSQHQFWQKTRHAHAYATLAKKKKQFDLDCIGCHVVGWQKPGGLYDIQQPQRLANVQCENCHSHGSIHATRMPTKKTIKRHVPAAVCTGCHQGSHDPTFNYEEKLKKILGKGHGEKRLAELLGKKK